MIEHQTIITLIRQIDTDGHSPYMALAEGFKPIIVKPQNNIYDKLSLQKEFVCNLLLQYFKINTPKAYCCQLAPAIQKVNNDIRLQYSAYYYGSELIKPQYELNELFQLKGKTILRNFKELDTFIKIALFDIWIENDDRKARNSNLLCQVINNQYHFCAIDHAFTFATMPFESLSDACVSFSDNDSILYAACGRNILSHLNINKDFIIYIKEYFYFCIYELAQQFDLLLASIPSYFALNDTEQASLKAYLFSEQRIKEALEILIYILNDLRK
jgi:hypothetical protein